MPLHKILTPLLIPVFIVALTGCDYLADKASTNALKIQQEKQQNQLDRLEKQQTDIINSTKIIANAVRHVDKVQQSQQLTEFDPSQTRYFILNNGSIAVAGRILSIDPINDGSVIHISLVNLLSVPVSNIGFHVTWGGEKPTDPKLLPKWQQLIFSTSMNSSLELLPGQWQDINLSLKGISPNNLKYLKMSINMENIQFERLQAAEKQKKKTNK